MQESVCILCDGQMGVRQRRAGPSALADRPTLVTTEPTVSHAYQIRQQNDWL